MVEDIDIEDLVGVPDTGTEDPDADVTPDVRNDPIPEESM